MVRLQLINRLPNIYGVKQSQFHYGSITTKQQSDRYNALYNAVSIPLWFDYNHQSSLTTLSYEDESQFHYGSITTT